MDEDGELIDGRASDGSPRSTQLSPLLALLNVYLNTGRYRAAVADTGIDAERRAQLASRFRARAEKWQAEEGEIASPQRMSAFVCSGPRRDL